MKLSKHVRRFQENGTEVLYHLVTKEKLPTDASEKELANKFFFDGQDEDAKRSYILRDPKILQITIIPTWGCTLRCPYCYVLKNLEGSGKPTDAPDIDQIGSFVERYLDKNKVKNVHVTWLGGEPLTNQSFCKTSAERISSICKNRGVHFSGTLTTNGTVPLDEDGWNFVKMLKSIMVSIDGVKEIHDKYRRKFSLKKEASPYIETVRFVKKLVECEDTKNIVSVQSAFSDEMFYNDDLKKAYLVTLLSIGVPRESIFMNYVNPTESYDRSNIFYENKPKSSKIRSVPCCCYRFFSYFVIDGKGIRANYFDKEVGFLGQLSDDISSIEQKYKDYIINKMPALHDPKCMDCDVIGLCWGDCHGAAKNPERPSEHCAQESLRKKIESLCSSSRLEEVGKRYEKHYGVEEQ